MIRTIKYLVIFSIIFSFNQGFSQTYEEIIENGKRKLSISKYNEALVVFTEGLNLKEVKNDNEKRSNIYFYMALSKYKLNDLNYKKDLNRSLLRDQGNVNACFLKTIYLKNNGYPGLARDYLQRTAGREFEAGVFLKEEIKSLIEDKEYASLIRGIQPDLINCYSNSYIIKEYVENNINQWQKKGRYEKTVAYTKRVNEASRNNMIEVFTQEAIDSIANSIIQLNSEKIEYDADNESFKIFFTDKISIIVNVPIDEAPSFDDNFTRIIQSNKKFTLNNVDEFAVLHLEFVNPSNNKSYIYDSEDDVAFSSTKLNLQFEEIEVVLPENALASNKSPEEVKTITVGKSDVDINIPETEKQRKNTYLLVIGNEDYTKYQNNLSSESNVDFARNDAISFAKYAEKTLGIPEKNITLITDAISSQMKRELIRLINKSKYGNENIELIFYYSGHGFPDIQSQEAYIMPVDISSTNVKDGIKLSKLYSDLSEFTPHKVTVILDACFSGGGRKQGLLAAKAVKIKPKEEILNKGNLVVLSASDGDQESLFYKEKQHGIFTYFLLKKLQESKGEITYGEMSDYLQKVVPLTSSDINYKEQNPQVNVSKEAVNNWEFWEF